MTRLFFFIPSDYYDREDELETAESHEEVTIDSPDHHGCLASSSIQGFPQ